MDVARCLPAFDLDVLTVYLPLLSNLRRITQKSTEPCLVCWRWAR
jgi:hypothetical protein